MNNRLELIITGLIFFLAIIAPWIFQPGVRVFGSVAFLILPGHFILRLFQSRRIEHVVTHYALTFPVSVSYLAVASYLMSQAGIDISYLHVMFLAGLPCLLWLSGSARKLC